MRHEEGDEVETSRAARRADAGRARLPGLVLATLGAIVLAGCAVPEDRTAAEESTPADIVAEDESQPPADIYDFSGKASSPYSGTANLPPVDDDPKQLIGLDRGALNEKLGEPALVRRDGDAEVWQYRGENCVLDLFLYGADKQVEHVDLRDRGEGDEISVRDCFVRMLRAAMATS